MRQDVMNYDLMTEQAMRGIIRDALKRVLREDGLPGDHHFYISFLTGYDGLDIDETLAQKYPEDMTIVLEHQFWDLSVNEDDFEVTLKFNGIPKHIKVPYLSITRFHDPSVHFTLEFTPRLQTSDVTERASTPLPSTASMDTGNTGLGDATVVDIANFRKK